MTTATPSVTKACSFKDFTATKSADVQSVAACATAVGDITIEGDQFGTIELTGLEQLYGKLSVKNATQATSFNAPTLQLVSETFELNSLTILATANLAQLTTVGTLHFNALPALQQTGLSAGITSAEEIIISDTGLTSLSGINVYKLNTFDVNNNGDIESIDSGLQKVSDVLSISYNADKVDVVFDQLTEVNNLLVESINSLSTPNLTKISGSLSLTKNFIDKIEFKQLKTVGKSFTVSDNDDLEELDFPKLTSVGGAFKIIDNEGLTSFEGFPELETIGGSVVLQGAFDNGSFESLERVSGGFNLTSTGDLSCTEFTKLNKAGDIKGDKFYCKGASSTVSSSSSKKGNKDGESEETDSSESSDSSDSSDSSSASSTKDSGASAPAGTLAAVVAGFAAIGVALY